MNLLNPPYSFVEFESSTGPEFIATEDLDIIDTEDGDLLVVEGSSDSFSDSVSGCDYALPIALEGDLKFQVVIETSGIEESQRVMEALQKLYVVELNPVITDEAGLTDNTLIALPDNFILTQVADNKILICWPHGLVGIQAFADGKCFRLCVRLEDGATVQYFISNCFVRVTDRKYTSVLDYSSDENNYGFNYCGGCDSNRIRIHLYLGSPQIKEEQSIYVRSSGNRKLLRYTGAELYELLTIFFTETIHKKITVALAHEIVNIVSYRYSGGIRKDGDYLIDWDTLNELKGPATAKVFAEDYFVKNNNCDECVPYVPTCAMVGDVVATVETIVVDPPPPPPPDCVGIAFSGSLSLPDASTMVPYVFSIGLTGTAPFSLASIIKPAWMTIAITGSTINFSGTPGSGDTGSDVPVSFTVTNDCGSEDFFDTINIVNNLTWHYTNDVGTGGRFRIVVNGTLTVDQSVTGDGSIPVNPADIIDVFVTSTVEGNAFIEISGAYTNDVNATHTVSDGFTAIAGSYDVSGQSTA